MKMNRAVTLLLGLTVSLVAVSQDLKKLELVADLEGKGKAFPKYWKSTGFSPADLLDHPDMEMTLDYLKASGAISYIRPHYLLDHVRITGFAADEQVVDFSGLDSKLDKIVGADLKLIFELMGNPSDREIDFADEGDLVAWRDFVRDLALHCSGRYGKETVESWFFETTNEPDLEYFWKQGTIRFMNYYDACSEGLLEADPKIRFGGPGTALGASATFKLLLEHCARGKNYFTGETGVRIDFVSTHRKNTPHQMIRDELTVWNYLEEGFPEMAAGLPVMNDEGDPIAGWGIPYYWRTGPWYGAFIVQSVELHNRLILDSVACDFILLSNDHGFLGSWGKRTLTARMLPGDDDRPTRGASRTGGSREVSVEGDDRPPVTDFYLIKKPSLTVMTLMELFGEERFDVWGMDDGSFPNAGAIVSRNADGDVVVAMFNKPEMDPGMNHQKPTMVPPENQIKILNSQGVNLFLHLDGLENGNYKRVHYRFDENHGHAYARWIEMGSPGDPTPSEYRELARAMEPEIVELEDLLITDHSCNLNVQFPSSGVSFMVLASRPPEPGKVIGLDYKKYTGLNGEEMIMLTWEKAASRGVLTYEVFAGEPDGGPFIRVNEANLLSSGFAHGVENATGTRYKVRMVDYWGRKGPFSDIVAVK
jgi:L-iduronidase